MAISGHWCNWIITEKYIERGGRHVPDALPGTRTSCKATEPFAQNKLSVETNVFHERGAAAKHTESGKEWLSPAGHLAVLRRGTALTVLAMMMLRLLSDEADQPDQSFVGPHRLNGWF